MWIFAVEGFVSVVEVRGHPDQLMVRGRKRVDVAAWARLVPGRVKVRQTPLADYPWRFSTTRKKFAPAIARVVAGIRYPNFKAAVGHADPERSRAYMEVWSTMGEFGAVR
jgi:hypothetical protein